MFKIIYYPEIDSTSDEAKRLVKKGAEEGTVVVAEKQTKGRGQPGKNWHSPQGGLYFSLILKPRKNPQDLAPLTLVVAEAVKKVISKLCVKKVEIKLPNDVLINGKKVCGILTERTHNAILVVGIGVNVNITEFPSDFIATSLKIECKREIEIKSLLNQTLEQVWFDYLKFLKKKV